MLKAGQVKTWPEQSRKYNLVYCLVVTSSHDSTEARGSRQTITEILHKIHKLSYFTCDSLINQ